MLFYHTVMSDTEKNVLEQVEKIRDSLKYTLRTPRRWAGLLRRNTLARVIRGSNSIEGYNVTAEDAIAAVEGEDPLDAERETWEAIRGYRTAMTYVLQLSSDPHFSYAEPFIKALHFMMLGYDLSKNPGRWRPGPIYVRDEEKGEIVYEGPDWELIPQFMSELTAELSELNMLPVMVRGAMAHLNLVMIHPFSDGNGRMARCLQTLVLSREGILEPPFCSIEEYLGRNTKAYYDVLTVTGKGKWSPRSDTRPWTDFCLTAHYKQAETLVRRTKELERVWNELEEQIARRHLPERVIYALSDATFGYKVRNANYRAIADVTDQVASRDLKSLVQYGFLMPDGEKRGRSYVAGSSLRAIRERAREPKEPLPQSFDNLYLPGLEPSV